MEDDGRTGPEMLICGDGTSSKATDGVWGPELVSFLVSSKARPSSRGGYKGGGAPFASLSSKLESQKKKIETHIRRRSNHTQTEVYKRGEMHERTGPKMLTWRDRRCWDRQTEQEGTRVGFFCRKFEGTVEFTRGVQGGRSPLCQSIQQARKPESSNIHTHSNVEADTDIEAVV